MTSEARKQAWLAAHHPAEPDTFLNTWAYVWRFKRRTEQQRQTCLCLLSKTRDFEVHILRPNQPIGKRNARNDRIASFLRSCLTEEQVAAGLASTITRNHAQGTSP